MKQKLTIRESFNLGKGWHLMIFAILAMLVTNAGVNDGLNIALPEITKGSRLNYELCLSMGTVAGFVGVAMMLVIAKFRDKFGGRKVSSVLFIIFGLTYYFLFLRAENIVMYAAAQCIMVSCGQGCFYLCTGPMQSDWFPKKRGVVNGISTIGANIGTAILAPLMTFLIGLADYKVSLAVFPVAAIILAIYAYITLRDDPIDAGMYPDNVTKEVYETEYKELENKVEYESESQIVKIFKVVVTIFVIIVVFFISYLIISIILKSRNIYYTTLRMLGATAKSTRKILNIELFINSTLSYLMVLTFGYLIKQDIIKIGSLAEFLEYITLNECILMYLILFVVTQLIARKFAKKIFKSSAMNRYNEEV